MSIIPRHLYRHFMLLSSAITIMEDPQLCKNENKLKEAHKFLIKYCKEGETHFGQDFHINNHHSLLHLVEDVRKFGCLTKNSAFPFENFNQTFKKFLKGKKAVLREYNNRYLEQTSIYFVTDLDTVKKKKHKTLFFILGGNCLSVETDAYTGEHDYINCDVFHPIRSFELYDVVDDCDSRNIFRFKTSKQFHRELVNKNLLLIEAIRLNTLDNCYAFLKLTHAKMQE